MAKLQRQSINIAFAGGVETKIDPKGVPPVRLLDLQNAVFTRATTIVKRNGYEAIGAGGVDAGGVAIASPRALARRGDELIQLTDRRAYSYRTSTDTWSDAGDVASVVASHEAIARTGTAQTMADLAAAHGVTLAAWEDSRGGVWYALTETASDRELVAPTQADALGSRPRCLAVGGVLMLLWAQASTGRLYVATFIPGAPSVAAPSILTTDLSTSDPAYDACTVLVSGALAVDGAGLIAWRIDGFGAGGYRIGYLHPSGVLGSPATGLPSVATYTPSGGVTGVHGPIAIAFDELHQEQVAIAFADGATVGTSRLVVRVLEPSAFTADPSVSDPVQLSALSSTAGWQRAALTWAIDELSTARALWWAAELGGPTSDASIVYSGAFDTLGSGTISATAAIRGHTLVSRAWVDGQVTTGVGATPGSVYVVIAQSTTYFPWYGVARISAGAGPATPIVARLLPGEALGAPTRTHVCSVIPTDPDPAGLLVASRLSRRWRLALGYRIQLAAETLTWGESGIRSVLLDFDSPTAWQSAQFGGGLYLAGAAPLHYDGDRWAEAGFHTAPDALAPISASTAAGASLSVGVYTYVTWYEEIDGAGELHAGPVSAPITVTTTAANTNVVIQLPTLHLTRRRRVRIAVARTIVNATGTFDQLAFYRVTSVDPTAVGANGYVVNDATIDAIAFTDALSDVALLGREPAYINGGILSNAPAPMAGGVLGAGKSRIFWTDPGDPDLVRFSQARRDESALEMAPELSVRIDPYGGAIVAIGVLDDVVIVFRESAIYAFGGAGPAAAPALDPAAGFSDPVLITSDVGCADAASLVLTPTGLMFSSAKGIMTLDRSRQLQRTGAPVYAYREQRITGAATLPDRSAVVFLTDADDGRTLLYDYERDQWSTWTNHTGRGVAVVGGVLHYLRTDDRVFRETVGAYSDAGRAIPMLIETAWLRFAGPLQAWQRVWYVLILGAYRSAHTLRVRHRIDYREAWCDPIDIDATADYDPSLYGAGAYGAGAYGGAGLDGAVYQQRIHVGLQAQAIAFRFEDVEPTPGGGASFELSELLLTGGILRADFPLGPDRSS